jgi:MlaC protein
VSVQEIQNQAAPHVPTMRTVLMHFSYWCLNAARVLAPYVFTVALALLVHPSARAANSTAENMAQTFVQTSIDKGYATLKDPALSADERENHFRALLPSLVDLKRIAAFAVDPYAHDASAAERDNFEKAFADFVITIHQRNLSANGDQTIRSTPKDKALRGLLPFAAIAAIRARAEMSVF